MTYDRGEPVIAFLHLGEPVGQGNIRHLGKGRPAVHQNKEILLPWRDGIAYRARVAMLGAEWPITKPVPVAVDLTFTMPKPASAPKRRRIYPVVRPDIDHLERAVLDALTTAGIWVDDSQVVEVTKRKVYPGEHPRALDVPGVAVRVYVINAEPETPPAGGSHDLLSTGANPLVDTQIGG